MSDFWKKVEQCKHENFYPNHYEWGSCGTPYCNGWHEVHCKDCGVFIIDCDCHVHHSMSGWSARRQKKRNVRVD